MQMYIHVHVCDRMDVKLFGILACLVRVMVYLLHVTCGHESLNKHPWQTNCHGLAITTGVIFSATSTVFNAFVLSVSHFSLSISLVYVRTPREEISIYCCVYVGYSRNTETHVSAMVHVHVYLVISRLNWPLHCYYNTITLHVSSIYS